GAFHIRHVAGRCVGASHLIRLAGIAKAGGVAESVLISRKARRCETKHRFDRILLRAAVVLYTEHHVAKEIYPVKRMIIQFYVKQTATAENQAYIERVFEELRANSPAGIRYVAF